MNEPKFRTPSEQLTQDRLEWVTEVLHLLLAQETRRYQNGNSLLKLEDLKKVMNDDALLWEREKAVKKAEHMLKEWLKP